MGWGGGSRSAKVLERRTTTGEQGVSGEGKQLLRLLLLESMHLVFEQLGGERGWVRQGI